MQEAVIKAFADKVPKVVVAAVDIVTTALRSEFKSPTLKCSFAMSPVYVNTLGTNGSPTDSSQQSQATGL